MMTNDSPEQIAIELWKTSAGNQSTKELDELRRVFAARVDPEVATKLLKEKIDYASRICDFPGQLIFEEMYKLITLLEEIFIFINLGETLKIEDIDNIKEVVISLFKRDIKNARFAAECCQEEWSKDLWHYSTLRKLQV